MRVFKYLPFCTQLIDLFIKRYWLLLPIVCSFINASVVAQAVNPGVDRWLIKTSLEPHPKHKTVTLPALLTLDNPIDHTKKEYETTRIPASGEDSLKEGDVITTTGWIELVALENDSKKHRDGDYHIQIRNSKEWGDTCLVVEIPYPAFIDDAALRDSCVKARNFVKARLLNGHEPSKKGTALKHPAYVRITGQLFF